MPNWCNNTIEIKGPKDKIKKLYEVAKEDNALLKHLYPAPEELMDSEKYPANGEKRPHLLKKYGFDNWYDWCVQNWQTKWEVDTEQLELSDDGTTISGWFDSAWAPPIGAYEHFLEQNEDCSIKAHYYEGGMDFGGCWEDFNDDMITISDYDADQMEDPSEGLIYDLNELFAFSEHVREWEAEQKTDTERFIVDKEAVNV